MMQELILRLGRAPTEAARHHVVLALNLLIPVALTMPDEGAPSAFPSGIGGSALGSGAINESNEKLRAYLRTNFPLHASFLRARAVSRGVYRRERATAVRALREVLCLMERDAELSSSWWSEVIATLKTFLRQPSLQAEALSAMRVFVDALDTDQLARGLPQLLLLALPCLASHTQAVVRCLDAMIVQRCAPLDADAGADRPIPDVLVRALGEIHFLPEHPALAPVHEVIARHVSPPELAAQLRSCARGLAHESGAVQRMALEQLAAPSAAPAAARCSR